MTTYGTFLLLSFIDLNQSRKVKGSQEGRDLTTSKSTVDPQAEFKMASFKPFYGKITAEDEVSLISEDLHNEKPTRSRKFRTSTVLLSLSTLVFGAYSLYTLVRPSTCQLPVCEIPTCEIPICEVTPCEVPPFSFQSGYATEWGT